MHILSLLASIDLSPLPQTNLGAGSSAVKDIFNIFLAISGATALLIITISGLKFTLSNGDPAGVAKAKNSIIYALIGLAVIAFAAVIVNFVFGRI